MYRMGIWMIALALVFNGVATSAWNGSSRAQAMIAQDHQAGAASAACELQLDAAALVKHSGQTQDRMHNHLKCCGTCTASLLPAVTAVPVTFSYKAASFRTAQHHLVGHLVALDPDIPKSFV